MDNCVFCKILKGDIPSTKIFENDFVLAFLDIQPVNNGHVLVVPKKHFVNIFDLPEDELCELHKAVQFLSPKIMQAVGAQGINILQNNGKVSGQLVMHCHIHIIPRFENDGIKHWSHSKYKSGEAENIAKEITKILKQNQ